MGLIIPNSFANKTSAQLSDLDENFTYLKTELDPFVDNIIVDAESGELTVLGGVVADVTGDVAGNVTGDLLGDVTGNVTGNVTGDLLGNVDGNISGTATLEGSSTLITGATLSSSQVGSIYAPGMIIQTVYKRVDTKAVVAFATAGSTGSFITDLDTVFTPKFANSLIHIQMCLTYEVHHDTVFRLYRDSTAIGINANDSNYWSGTWLPGYDNDNASTARTNHFFYIDTPNTTSEITYRLMIQSAGIGASSFYLNRTIGAVGQANYEVGISQIIIQEIAQ